MIVSAEIAEIVAAVREDPAGMIAAMIAMAVMIVAADATSVRTGESGENAVLLLSDARAGKMSAAITLHGVSAIPASLMTKKMAEKKTLASFNPHSTGY